MRTRIWRRTSHHRRAPQSTFASFQRRLASSVPTARAQAALGLIPFAQVPAPSNPNNAPRTLENFPCFELAVNALSSALSLEGDPAVRAAIRDAIKKLAIFADTDGDGQPLLHRLITRLAAANRVVRDRFIRVFAEWSASNTDADIEAKARRYLVALAPFCREPLRFDSARNRFILDALTRFGEQRTDTGEITQVSAFHVWREVDAATNKEATVLFAELARTTQQLIDVRDALTDTLRFRLAPPGFPQDTTLARFPSPNDHSGLDLRGCFLGGADLRKTRLHGAFLNEAILTGADLSQAWLPGTWLSVAQLQKATLKGARLQNASLDYACLQEANLIGAQLSHADINFADLRESNLYKAGLEEVTLVSSDLRGAVLRGARLSGAMLQGAILQGSDLKGANMDGAYLEDIDLQGIDLGGTSLQKAFLREASLQGACLRRAQLQGADLCFAHLEVADLTGAQLQQACLDKARLEGTNFRDADLGEVALYGVFVRETAAGIHRATMFPEGAATVVRFEPKYRFYRGTPVRDDESDTRTARIKAWLMTG